MPVGGVAAGLLEKSLASLLASRWHPDCVELAVSACLIAERSSSTAALLVPAAAQRWVVKRVTGDGAPLTQAEQRAGRRWANRAMVTLRPGGAFDAA